MGVRIATMLVDDDAGLRQLLKAELEDSGAFTIVAEAQDGADAIQQVQGRADALQLVLLDLEMPRMDGLAALPRIRAALGRADVVVLSMREDLAEQALRLGAAGFVHKGLEAGALVRRLQAILAGLHAGSPSSGPGTRPPLAA